MSMFDKHKSKNNPPASQDTFELPDRPPPIVTESGSNRLRAVIGPGITIRGDIGGEENLTIEGHVEGSILLDAHEVCIGQAGQVVANVTARVVRVEGEVTGDITGYEKVVLTRSGNVRGNISAPRVTLEDGAKFKGSIDMDPGDVGSSVAALPSHSSSAKMQPESVGKDSSYKRL